jgi:hypothetical protein
MGEVEGSEGKTEPEEEHSDGGHDMLGVSFNLVAMHVLGKLVETLAGQVLALVAFVAFPAFQYMALKRFSKNEGAPQLWYLPSYGFRLVIRNLPGKRSLSEIKYKAIVRNIIRRNSGSSVATLQDEVLVENNDMFLFPGTDQILISFQLQGSTPDDLDLVITDKLGQEKSRIPLANFRKLICAYTATLNNPLNFSVKLAKRTEIESRSLSRIWREIQANNIEQGFTPDRIRNVG